MRIWYRVAKLRVRRQWRLGGGQAALILARRTAVHLTGACAREWRAGRQNPGMNGFFAGIAAASEAFAKTVAFMTLINAREPGGWKAVANCFQKISTLFWCGACRRQTIAADMVRLACGGRSQNWFGAWRERRNESVSLLRAIAQAFLPACARTAPHLLHCTRIAVRL